ncbi:MAG: hypothetical protein AAFR27_09185 [Pseudomonadota bacterium]
MRSKAFLKTVVPTTVATLIGLSTAFAGPISSDIKSITQQTATGQADAHLVHYKRRHHIHRRGAFVVPNANVTVNGIYRSASKSRSVVSNGDGTWNAERSRSITNNNTGVTCSRNGSFDSATRTGTVSGGCTD